MASLLLLAACSEEVDERTLPQVNRPELIGHAVNFSASHAEEFTTRASVYNHNGAFNEGDLMTIYRQYSEDGGHNFDRNTEAYRVYYYKWSNAGSSGYVFDRNWQVKEGALGSNSPGTTFPQQEKDSLTWENGKTVRFRAWSRSNLDECIAGSASTNTSSDEARRQARKRYYPDFCVAEWVTVSGPTDDVALTLKHQGCRIGFTTKRGNELVRAEICTDVEDYRRKDNAVMRDGDESEYEHGKSLQQAQAEADAVKAVYNRMCMPAGVSVETSLLATMTQALYDAPTTNLSKIHEVTGDGIVNFGTQEPEYIAESVQRPLFCSNNGRLYMVTIPYDMSNAATSGETLTLPACTRIKIYLYDVNNGDAANTGSEEATYHIFTLGDIMDKQSGSDRKQLFPKGMELGAGISYLFSVGYYYDQFTITPADDFAWDEQDMGTGASTDEQQTIKPEGTYQWWKDAIKAAIPKNISQSYNPQFYIDTEEEFIEFINLVNGTATTKTSGLTHKIVTVGKDKTGKDSTAYRWYPTDLVEAGTWKVADSVSHEQAIAEGYIFYEHYFPADGDQKAYSVEDYLRGPYSFYDQNLNKHFTVTIGADLDFRDQKLATIGKTAATPFRGNIEGYDETNRTIHTLKNVNMDDGTGGHYLFGYCNDIAIRNIQVETYHDFMLLRQSTAMNTQSGSGAFIVGVTVKAPSSGNPLAGKLLGNSYVVGCFYQGEAGGALVGEANNLNMFGNMVAATGLTKATGALLGAYAQGSSQFFAPQAKTQKLQWSRFMVNYYDTSLSPTATAVGSVDDDYHQLQYIRGRQSWILKAINDNMITSDMIFDQLPRQLMKEGFYGLAPWKAMNYAISKYNVKGGPITDVHNCKSHFVNSTTGYAHQYPQRVFGEPDSEFDLTGYKDKYNDLNILELLN